jgi:maleate cis-trans isomerase
VTSETYAGSRRELTAGGIIIMTVSCLSALLLIAAISYALGTGGRTRAALAAAGCEPTLTPSMQQCTTQPILKSQYLAVITPATQQLNTDAAAYASSEGDNLTVAEAALKAEVTSERALDASLTAFAFPPAIIPLARALIRADQARAALTAEQAGSSSLTRLRSFNHQVQVANAAVQTEMKLVQAAVDAPLPGA